jgi:general secretion pathway protein H
MNMSSFKPRFCCRHCSEATQTVAKRAVGAFLRRRHNHYYVEEQNRETSGCSKDLQAVVDDYCKFWVKGTVEDGRRGNGFTLIELILVLVIMGLLTALVTPAITSLTGLKLKAAARKVAAGLRYARSQAVATGSDYQVVFNLEKGEMTIEPLEEEEETYYNREDVEQEEYGGKVKEETIEEEDVPKKVKKKTYMLPEEVTLAKVIVEGEEITEDDEVETWIDFYSNGSCSGGEIFLADERERTYRIALNFLTGIVEITEEEEI